MQPNTPVNRNVLIALAVVLVAAVLYFVFSGGFSSVFQSDIPEFVPQTTSQPTATAPATAPGSAAPPAAPGVGAPAAPGIGGPGGAQPAGPGGPAAIPPAGGGELTMDPSVAAAAAAAQKLTPEDKLAKLEAFRKIDAREILERRIEEAKESETKVDPDKGLPYYDVGRTDPLFVVSDKIPEELRPPRTGESDADKIFGDLMRKARQTAMLESVRIEVWSVMKIGLVTMVNLTVDGMIGTVPVGRTVPMGSYSFTVTSASQQLVTIVLRAGEVSKTRSFVPKD